MQSRSTRCAFPRLVSKSALATVVLASMATLTCISVRSEGTAACGEVSSGAETLLKHLDEYVNPWLEAHDFAGTVMLARGDSILACGTYGDALMESGIPVRSDTRFHIASLTKTFTAASVVQLAERGRLRLDGPTREYLPEYDRAGDMTVEQMLLHRAGVPDQHGFPGWSARARKPMTLEELGGWIMATRLDYVPGESAAYSNAGYDLLALIVQRVSGMPFEEYVRTNLLEPLNLSSTGFLTERDIPNLARGYIPGPPPTGLVPAVDLDWSYVLGSGSMYSTSGDLIRWLRANARGEVVDWGALPYWYGWSASDEAGELTIGQQGSHFGFVAGIKMYLRDTTLVAYASNVAANGPFGRLYRDLGPLARGEAVPSPSRGLSVAVWPDSTLEAYVGSYAADDGMHEIRLKERGLFAYSEGNPQGAYLQPTDNGDFWVRSDGILVRARHTKDGGVELTWGEGGPVWKL